jgi:hypothetical protein
MNRGVLPKSRARDYYASHVAGIFRTLRFGTGEVHARAEMMEFNYFAELKAALNKTTSVPVDIDPMTAFGDAVR